MDMWKYFGITHTDHRVMDPMSLDKTDEMIEQLRLDSGHILDIACGKANGAGRPWIQLAAFCGSR